MTTEELQELLDESDLDLSDDESDDVIAATSIRDYLDTDGVTRDSDDDDDDDHDDNDNDVTLAPKTGRREIWRKTNE